MFRTVLTALVATLWLAAMGESRPAQSPDATTTTFTYTATERLSRFEFDGISNIVSPVRGDRNRVRGCVIIRIRKRGRPGGREIKRKIY